jgi:hypothetical protein
LRGKTAGRTTTTPMTMLAKPRPQPDVIAVHLAAAAEINLSCQPLTDRPTAELLNLRSNSPLQRPMQLADSTYLPKHSMPIYSKLVPCSPWLNQFHRRHTTFRYLPAMFNKIANHIRRRSPWQITLSTSTLSKIHRLLPANTHSSDPKSPAAYLQQFTARAKSP